MQAIRRLFQIVLYLFCAILIISIAYDMSYAAVKVFNNNADFLYDVIFLIMASIQFFFFSSMLYVVRKRSQKVSSYLGQYLFFTPLLFCIFYAVTGSENSLNFAPYVLPMFHKISIDLLYIFISDTVISFYEKIISITVRRQRV